MSRVSTSLTGVVKKVEEQFSEASVPSPRLDAEVLLAYVLGVERSWLHAHGDEELQPESVEKFAQLVQRRLRREPIAYITGEKEFYGREFIITPDVLIPRPETEDLIDLAKEHYPQDARIIDVGAGSGCVGITLRLEIPKSTVTLADISEHALFIAKKNAKALGAQVSYVKTDLLASFRDSSFDLIVANLPYVDSTWETSPETDYEPKLALYAENGGLALIYKLIEQSESVVSNSGLLFLEADPEQHIQIIKKARQHSFEPLEIRGYALCFTKLKQA